MAEAKLAKHGTVAPALVGSNPTCHLLNNGMHYLIYQITHIASGKIYIGKHQTNDPNDGYMGSGKHITRAIRKYGIDAFQKIILFSFSSEDEMNNKERELVTEDFCARDDTYNICSGGSGGFGYINRTGLNGAYHNYPGKALDLKKASKEGRAKIDQLRKNSEYVIWFRNNVLNGVRNHYTTHPGKWVGKKHSKASKLKMSLAKRGKCTGRANNRFGAAWYTNGSENKSLKPTDIVPSGWYRGRVMRK